MKTITQRGLPLTEKYTVIDKKYIPLENSQGLCCDNCNKLIANIATVKNEMGKSFNVGFDCLETILINNGLISTAGVTDYEKIKKAIPKILRFAKALKENIKINGGLTGFLFERPTGYFIETGWITYYFLKDGHKPYNSNVRLREVDFDFLINTLKNIFPKLEIKVK